MLKKTCTLHLQIKNWIGIALTRRTYCAEAGSVADLHKLSLAGDQQTLERLLAAGGDVNGADRRGRTALMEAARAGRVGALQALLSHGADTSRVCKSGHTAADFAQFWNQKECYDVLSARDTVKDSAPRRMFFCTSTSVNRAGTLREDPDLLREKLTENATRFLLLHDLSPVTSRRGSRLRVVWTSLSDLQPLLGLTDPSQLASMAVLLGVYTPPGGSSRGLKGVTPGAALFAVDVSGVKPEGLKTLGDDVDVAPGVMGMLAMTQEEGALCAQARALIDWHQKNKHCSVCGSSTYSTHGGYKRVCEDTSCSTHKAALTNISRALLDLHGPYLWTEVYALKVEGVHNVSHPRVDPSVITLVLHPAREACILARGRHFPPGMYSSVAGFVEPGESVEQACRREVEEEVGVSIGHVTYINSQPWPSPSALMLGCTGQAVSTELQVDSGELEDARWFGRHEVVEMITRSHKDRLFIPPPQAIANHLVKTWLKETAFQQKALNVDI